MKIAIDGLLLHGHYSGVERCILDLVRALSHVDAENEYVLYTGRGFGEEGISEERVRVKHTLFHARSRLLRIMWQQLVLPLRLRLGRFDLLHAPGYVMPVLTRVPTVVTIYDIIALRAPELCKKSNVAHYSRVLPRTARRARSIIVPSLAVKQELILELDVPPEKVHVVHPGVSPALEPPTEEEKERVRHAHGLPDQFVLFVGNLEPKKNLPLLIKAYFAAKMNRRLPHKLVIVGAEGWKHEPTLSLAKELDIKEDVVFTGYFPEGDMKGLYGLADAFVFPSLREGFGLPPLEAMACGTPVITSDIPPLLEVTADAALHVAPTDTKALREALESLLEDADLHAKLRAKGLERAKQFTWEKAAQQTIDVYRRTAERS